MRIFRSVPFLGAQSYTLLSEFLVKCLKVDVKIRVERALSLLVETLSELSVVFCLMNSGLHDVVYLACRTIGFIIEAKALRSRAICIISHCHQWLNALFLLCPPLTLGNMLSNIAIIFDVLLEKINLLLLLFYRILHLR